MNPLSILGVGLLLGIRHATDADHVVAVSTIVTQQKKLKSASIIGALWGIGHTLTVFIVGVAIIVFHVVIPPRLGLFMEFAVALALIGLGILNLTGMMAIIVNKLTPGGHTHSHLHLHDNDPHIHVHAHDNHETAEGKGLKVSLKRFIHEFGLFQFLRPIVIGLIHGLAGSAAVALLILSTISDPTTGVLYLLIFGAGTIIGMMGITTLIGLPIIVTTNKFGNMNRYINLASGMLSLIFGLYLAYEIGITQQLFGANPQWDPH